MFTENPQLKFPDSQRIAILSGKKYIIFRWGKEAGIYQLGQKYPLFSETGVDWQALALIIDKRSFFGLLDILVLEIIL